MYEIESKLTKRFRRPDLGEPSASDTALKRIVALIHQRHLRPGDWLPSEGELAAECAVSRNTVREAVRALAQLGVLDIGNGRRPKVGQISGENLAILIDHAVKTTQVTVLQTWDLRQTIEARVVRLAALRRGAEHLREMRRLGEVMDRNLDDHMTLCEADIDLHLTWANASSNPLYLVLIQSLVNVMRWTGPLGYQAIGSRERVEGHITIHHQINDAIENRRADDAVIAMQKHFEQARTAMIDSGFD